MPSTSAHARTHGRTKEKAAPTPIPEGKTASSMSVRTRTRARTVLCQNATRTPENKTESGTSARSHFSFAEHPKLAVMRLFYEGDSIKESLMFVCDLSQ